MVGIGPGGELNGFIQRITRLRRRHEHETQSVNRQAQARPEGGGIGWIRSIEVFVEIRNAVAIIVRSGLLAGRAEISSLPGIRQAVGIDVELHGSHRAGHAAEGIPDDDRVSWRK